MDSKVILITGASRGIGRATAERFASKGYRVVATMRTPDTCAPFVNTGICIKPLDVTKPETIKQAVEETLREYSQIDVLINNAGCGLFSPIELADDKQVFEQFDVNVFGVLRTIRAVLPSMREKKSGQILNVSSIAGFSSNAGLGVYCATKHAVEAISASLASNVFPWNIQVSVVEPGPVATEFAEVMHECIASIETSPYQNFMDAYRERIRVILSEGQAPEEVAEVIERIVEANPPNFRYQTSPELRELAKKFLVDPDGNQWLEEQKEKFAHWLV